MALAGGTAVVVALLALAPASGGPAPLRERFGPPDGLTRATVVGPRALAVPAGPPAALLGVTPARRGSPPPPLVAPLPALPRRRPDMPRETTITVGSAACDTNLLAFEGPPPLARASQACNGAPVAHFIVTPSPVLPGGTATLNGSTSTDADGTVTRYEWDLDSSTATGVDGFELDNGANPQTTKLFSTRGSFAVRLRVSDNATPANRDIHIVNVSVTKPPIAVIAAPSPVSPVSGEQVTFNGSASADDPTEAPVGTITRYEWDLDNNGSYETSTNTTPTVTTTFTTPGTKTIGLRVTDNDGAPGITTRTLTVANRPPVAALTGPSPAAIVGVPAIFDASASSDPDGTIVRYEWDLDGNGVYELDTAGNSRISNPYAAPGTVLVGLRVTDDFGATATATVLVRITRAPIALFSATPSNAIVGQPVSFDASSATDLDGTIARYEWDLDGNGSYETNTGEIATYTRSYPNPTAIGVGLRVTDNDGASATHMIVIQITGDPLSPGGGGGGGSTSGGTKPGSKRTAGGGSDADGGGGGGPSGSGGLVASLDGRAVQKLRKVLKGGVALSCRADRAVTCALTLQISPTDARRLRLKLPKGKRRPVTVGSAKVSLSKAGVAAVTVKISRRFARKLRRGRRLRLMARGTARDAAGHTVAITRAVLLRR